MSFSLWKTLKESTIIIWKKVGLISNKINFNKLKNNWDTKNRTWDVMEKKEKYFYLNMVMMMRILLLENRSKPPSKHHTNNNKSPSEGTSPQSPPTTKTPPTRSHSTYNKTTSSPHLKSNNRKSSIGHLKCRKLADCEK